MNPLIKAHVFLRKADLSAEKQSQIVSSAMSGYEYEPLRDAMLTAIPRAGALRGGVPLHRKQSGTYSALVVDAQDEEDKEEHVLEVNEGSDDELVAMMTIAEQRRAEVDQARQFFRKHQSSENRKAKLDKLKQKLPCSRRGQLGHPKDDNDCRANVKVVNWEETEEQDTEELHPLLVTTFFVTRERNMWNHQRCNRYRILAGTCLFEIFEVELERHATNLEVVPDNETFRFGPGVGQKSSLAVIFPVAVVTERVLFESKISGRGGSLVDQYGSGEAAGKRD